MSGAAPNEIEFSTEDYDYRIREGGLYQKKKNGYGRLWEQVAPYHVFTTRHVARAAWDARGWPRKAFDFEHEAFTPADCAECAISGQLCALNSNAKWFYFSTRDDAACGLPLILRMSTGGIGRPAFGVLQQWRRDRQEWGHPHGTLRGINQLDSCSIDTLAEWLDKRGHDCDVSLQFVAPLRSKTLSWLKRTIAKMADDRRRANAGAQIETVGVDVPTGEREMVTKPRERASLIIDDPEHILYPLCSSQENATMNTYTYAVVQRATVKQKEEGGEDLVLMDGTIAAADEKSAALKVGIEHAEKLSAVRNLTILIRPF